MKQWRETSLMCFTWLQSRLEGVVWVKGIFIAVLTCPLLLPYLSHTKTKLSFNVRSVGRNKKEQTVGDRFLQLFLHSLGVILTSVQEADMEWVDIAHGLILLAVPATFVLLVLSVNTIQCVYMVASEPHLPNLSRSAYSMHLAFINPDLVINHFMTTIADKR